MKELLEWAGLEKEHTYVDATTRREYFERVLSDERCLQYIANCQPKKGMGVDARDMYLIRLMPKHIRLEFIRLIREMVTTR